MRLGVSPLPARQSALSGSPPTVLGVHHHAGKARLPLLCESCEVSRQPLREKQIADLSGTGPQCV